MTRTVLCASALVLLALACEREDRDFHSDPAAATPKPNIVMSSLQPGPVAVIPKTEAPYDDNAWMTAEGMRLYHQMNCSGCHFEGGGGIGPPLMDDEWIYGSDPANIYATIAEGRPGGMPPWGTRMTPQQIWTVVSYVRSLSGLTPRGARPGRSDHMSGNLAPQNRTPEKPKPTFTPPASWRP
ncbi:MAG: cytochrome c class [Gemmatimonadetes bacterium]|nr:cytochrome c class [Gemmatimonadota bacterium]